METVSEILNAAADLLEKPGAWTTGDYARGDDCFCALGAICEIEGQVKPRGNVVVEKEESDASRAFALFVMGEPEPYHVARWNDAPGRTQAEVVAALRAAATHQTGEPG